MVKPVTGPQRSDMLNGSRWQKPETPVDPLPFFNENNSIKTHNDFRATDTYYTGETNEKSENPGSYLNKYVTANTDLRGNAYYEDLNPDIDGYEQKTYFHNGNAYIYVSGDVVDDVFATKYIDTDGNPKNGYEVKQIFSANGEVHQVIGKRQSSLVSSMDSHTIWNADGSIKSHEEK